MPRHLPCRAGYREPLPLEPSFSSSVIVLLVSYRWERLYRDLDNFIDIPIWQATCTLQDACRASQDSKKNPDLLRDRGQCQARAQPSRRAASVEDQGEKAAPQDQSTANNNDEAGNRVSLFLGEEHYLILLSCLRS